MCTLAECLVDAGRGRVARIQQTEGDSSQQFRPWMSLREHRRAAGSLSCVHTTGALRCTEINDSEGVLGVFVPGKRTGDAFCLWSGSVPSGPSPTGRGVPKWAQTQLRGASAGRESDVHWSRLGLGAPDACRKRKAAATEPYLRTTKRNSKRSQKMCSRWFETEWALKYFRLHP